MSVHTFLLILQLCLTFLKLRTNQKSLNPPLTASLSSSSSESISAHVYCCHLSGQQSATEVKFNPDSLV